MKSLLAWYSGRRADGWAVHLVASLFTWLLIGDGQSCLKSLCGGAGARRCSSVSEPWWVCWCLVDSGVIRAWIEGFEGQLFDSWNINHIKAFLVTSGHRCGIEFLLSFPKSFCHVEEENEKTLRTKLNCGTTNHCVAREAAFCVCYRNHKIPLKKEPLSLDKWLGFSEVKSAWVVFFTLWFWMLFLWAVLGYSCSEPGR